MMEEIENLNSCRSDKSVEISGYKEKLIEKSMWHSTSLETDCRELRLYCRSDQPRVRLPYTACLIKTALFLAINQSDGSQAL